MTDNRLKYKPDFARAQKYWDAFWNHELIDRPCTVLIADNSGLQKEMPRLQGVDSDFNIMIDKYDCYLKSHYFMAECIPGFRPGFGPDQFAGFLGTPIKVDYETNTSWSEKIVENWQDFLPLKINENDHLLKRMHEFNKTAEAYCRGKCLLYEIDLHSNIDCLEAMRGAEKLLFDLIDTPDLIEEVMKQVRPLYGKIYDAFGVYGQKDELGRNTCMGLYSRGKTDYIQADFISLLSPDMVRKFVLPAIEEEARFLTNSCFHLDGPGALAHLDDILSIKEIDVVQWLPGAGVKPQHEWPDILHKIQSAGKAVILYGDCELVKQMHKEYKPELVVYYVNAKTLKEAEELLDWLKRNT